jgi:ectoine hydroxylase-related dioxygenase (phytanoyl-CoA dioxygenase family)
MTQDQIRALDSAGYVILQKVIPEETLEELRDIFEREAALKVQGGTRHADFNGVEEVQSLRSHALVTAGVRHILGDDFEAAPLHGRDPLPGFGQQGLHADAPQRTGPFLVATTIWMLDDFTPHNGPTRLVPATHVLPGPVPKALAAPANHHPKEIFAVAPAGSVLLFNGHLWHSGSRNNNKGRRRALQGAYHRPEFFYFSGMADKD